MGLLHTFYNTLTNGEFTWILSTDPKPVPNPALSYLYEPDTGKTFKYINNQWVEVTPANLTCYVEGVKKTASKALTRSSIITTAGVAVFNLTDSSNNAIFTNPYIQSVDLWAPGASATYSFDTPVISADKKTLTVNVNKLGTTSKNVLTNLLGNLISVVTGITYSPAPVNTVVYLSILGE